ncbi:MAG: competence/damage-inducible protein A [Bacteroidales bacterium]|nr:competence/damage-inducible protein A [Bacteroidales bacterium]
MNAIVEIINIGDELLIGQVVNSNASWMGSALSKSGFFVKQIKSVADDRKAIETAVNESIEVADIVLISGGLGPTKDDITKKVLAEYFESEMYFNEDAYQHIQQLFESRGFQVTEVNKNQAYLPTKAQAIPNFNGTAYGMWFEKQSSIVVSMPGVPFEMKTMMEKEVIPRLMERFQPDKYYHQTIMTQGLGESFLANKIEAVESKLPDHIKLAYLPRPGIVRLRFSARGEDEKLIKHQVGLEVEKVKQIIGNRDIFGYDDINIEESLAEVLRNSSLKIATAESCTGGKIAHLITSVPGSSAFFNGSIVSYSNEIKHDLLGVDQDDLEKYGAVSKAVIIQMAEGAKKVLRTDYAVATSGIAGPEGGSDDKPVGYTWIAVAGPNQTKAVLHQFGEHRGRNIDRASLTALNMLRVMILEDLGKI